MKKLLLVICLFASLASFAQVSPQVFPQIYKVISATTTKTGTIAWTPSTSKRIAITSMVISTYGTTSGKFTAWFGDSVAINDSVRVLDTVYTAGTDQPVIIATFSPISTSKPTLVFTPNTPIFCNFGNRKLKYTTDADLSIDVIIYGYEW